MTQLPVPLTDRNVASMTERDKIGMIVTFTDFGAHGPYLGQMQAAIIKHAPDVRLIDLLSNAPVCNPWASAYLLAALSQHFPAGTVHLCVVDPGVGGNRKPVMVQADRRWFVGPSNGLFEIVGRRHPSTTWEITWKPDHLSQTFHGRDLFGPIAAQLATGIPPQALGLPIECPPLDWPDDLHQVIYIDHYGNAITGIRGQLVERNMLLNIADTNIPYAERFDCVAKGQAFWYVNSCGLVEIAVNQGRADLDLCVNIGASAQILKI